MRTTSDSKRMPKTLVENRVSFAGPEAELSIYDTYQPAENVALKAGELLYCGMISGRKVLHAKDAFQADFLPQQSFVMAPGEEIFIDFPEAKLKAPTTCLTVEISSKRIVQVCDRLNVLSPRSRELEEWHFEADERIHTQHSQDTQLLLERLAKTFTENVGERDLLIDYGVSELVLRMLSYQTRSILLHYSQNNPELNGLTAAISELTHHFDKPLNIDHLSRIACMSRSRFFSQFKLHMASSPSEFQHQLRLKKAAELLKAGHSATYACYQVGYQDPSHFSRRFLLFHGQSPREFQQSMK